MAFWDNFKKTVAVGSLVAGTVGLTAAGIGKVVNSRHKRKLESQKLEIDMQKQEQSERKDLLAQEIKLKELELQQRKMDSSAYVDLAKTSMSTSADLKKTQMTTDRDIQTTGIKGSTDVQKAKFMYADGGIANSAMFSDKENGIMVDNRNVAISSTNPGLLGVNYQQVALTNNTSMSNVQKKLLDASNLLKQGLISREEYNAIKADILKESF